MQMKPRERWERSRRRLGRGEINEAKVQFLKKKRKEKGWREKEVGNDVGKGAPGWA